MQRQWIWVSAFLVLYTAHAAFILAGEGRILTFLPDEAVRIGGIASLVTLLLLVAAHIATRDEVVRRLALYGAAASALATGALSYSVSAFGIAAPVVTSNLWAIGILVFLVVYGALAWRAGS